MDSHGRRRRRAVNGKQLLALGAAAVAEAGREACTKAGRAKEDGVGRATVVFTANGVVASPPAVADFSALELCRAFYDQKRRYSKDAGICYSGDLYCV